MANIIEELEAAQVAKLAAVRAVPEFQPGDTLIVNVRVKEGERTRVQAYEGVCIARTGGGLNESFTVRKISYGEGVERVFPIYSPMIDSIKVVRRGKVRRAKLYYLRDRRGKSARIAEKMEATSAKTARAEAAEAEAQEPKVESAAPAKAPKAKAAKKETKTAAPKAAAPKTAAPKTAAPKAAKTAAPKAPRKSPAKG